MSTSSTEGKKNRDFVVNFCKNLVKKFGDQNKRPIFSPKPNFNADPGRKNTVISPVPSDRSDQPETKTGSLATVLASTTT